MIGFELSEEQKALQQKARKFAIEEMIPVSRKHDLSGEFPWEVAQKAWESGLLNTQIPKKYGGSEMSLLEACLIVEEMAAADPGMATSLYANNLGAEPIILAGTDEQKKKFLTPLTETLSFISFATSEPSMGSDVAGIQTEAVKVEGGYELNGRKFWITNAPVADHIVVFATLDKKLKHKGIISLVVPAKTEGVKIGKPMEKMGHRASPTSFVKLENVFIPEKNRLGNEGQGFLIAMKTFSQTRPAIGAFATGVARGAMEYALNYSKKRTAFGTQISNFQAIQFKIADIYKNLEAARLLTWKAAWEADNGLDNTITASIAKAFGSDIAMAATTEAIQIFGGFGYTKNYLVEKLFRDAKLYQIYEGTSEIQRMVISRHVLENYKPVFEKIY
ncbi:MAG: acyl-CoA dehydrogenase family protein [Candidatus Hodarchaeota archaeon]